MDDNARMYRSLLRRKPYRLLRDPVSGRAAAYDGANQMVAPVASEALVEFALRHYVDAAPWDAEVDRICPLVRAHWMPRGDLDGWMIYWLRNGSSSLEHVSKIPDN